MVSPKATPDRQLSRPSECAWHPAATAFGGPGASAQRISSSLAMPATFGFIELIGSAWARGSTYRLKAGEPDWGSERVRMVGDLG